MTSTPKSGEKNEKSSIDYEFLTSDEEYNNRLRLGSLLSSVSS